MIFFSHLGNSLVSIVLFFTVHTIDQEEYPIPFSNVSLYIPSGKRLPASEKKSSRNPEHFPDLHRFIQKGRVSHLKGFRPVLAQLDEFDVSWCGRDRWVWSTVHR